VILNGIEISRHKYQRKRSQLYRISKWQHCKCMHVSRRDLLNASAKAFLFPFLGQRRLRLYTLSASALYSEFDGFKSCDQAGRATGLPPPVQFPVGFVTSAHSLCENCGNDPSFCVGFRYML
jgi:hypothetical protein